MEQLVVPDLDVTLVLARLVDKMRTRGSPPADQDVTTLVQHIAEGFKVKREEVALLRVSPDGKMLSFLYPTKLSLAGTIPLNTMHSLATRTLRERRGEIVNSFTAYKHLTVFESLDLSAEEKAAPIQKIMSTPMMLEGKVVGVVQVCRKMRPGAGEAPDFQPPDLAQLEMVATILGKILAELPAPSPKSAQRGA